MNAASDFRRIYTITLSLNQILNTLFIVAINLLSRQKTNLRQIVK